MLLKELTFDQLKEIADKRWGENQSPENIVADALRAEACSRGITTRRTLCNRVLQLLQPIYQIQLAFIKEVLENLEYSGDITGGANGQIAAAPLRAVQIDSTQFLIVGGPDTKSLQTVVDCQIDNAALPRRAKFQVDADIARQLTLIKARILSPQRWSGIDRAPEANGAWLSSLDEELEFCGRDSSVLDSKCDEWRAYIATDSTNESSRWTRAKPGTHGRLWRAKHLRGYWVYVWTNQQQHPTQGKHLLLTANDAHRTRFAIDRETGKSLTVEYQRENDTIIIQLTTLLPYQEFRFLTTIGNRHASSISFPLTALDDVASLFERLGITVKERGI